MSIIQTRLTPENWTYCHYKSLQLKAFICMSGDPNVNQPVYSVTTTDLEEQELFQKDFLELGQAVDFINQRYGTWEFVNAQNSSGCDSCGNT